jgi:hypothetical protein
MKRDDLLEVIDLYLIDRLKRAMFERGIDPDRYHLTEPVTEFAEQMMAVVELDDGTLGMFLDGLEQYRIH